MTPETRKLDDGSWVVDYGSKWFRLRPDGSIVARYGYTPPGQTIGRVKERAPTKVEIIAVKKWVKQAIEAARPCTCHPDDNPPVPCAKQYAYSDCLAISKALSSEVKS